MEARCRMWSRDVGEKTASWVKGTWKETRQERNKSLQSSFFIPAPVPNRQTHI